MLVSSFHLAKSFYFFFSPLGEKKEIWVPRNSLIGAVRYWIVNDDLFGKAPEGGEHGTLLVSQTTEPRVLKEFIVSLMTDDELITAEREQRISPEQHRQVVEAIHDNAKTILEQGLERADKISKIIRDFIELYDGSGPQGKVGEEILPEAQLLNLACVIYNKLNGICNRLEYEENKGEMALIQYLKRSWHFQRRIMIRKC